MLLPISHVDGKIGSHLRVFAHMTTSLDSYAGDLSNLAPFFSFLPLALFLNKDFHRSRIRKGDMRPICYHCLSLAIE